MNARDVIQALLDGKTVVFKDPPYPQVEYRLREGFIEVKEEGVEGTTLKTSLPYIETDRCFVQDDRGYLLNFATAMLAAIQAGRRIRSVETGLVYAIEGAILVHFDSGSPASLTTAEVKGRWRLVR